MSIGGPNHPICYKCGVEIIGHENGFIGRADQLGNDDALFVVYCPDCGEQFNVDAQETDGPTLTRLSATEDPSETARSNRIRHAAC